MMSLVPVNALGFAIGMRLLSVLTIGFVVFAIVAVISILFITAKISEKSVGEDGEGDDRGAAPRRMFTWAALNFFGVACTAGVLRFFFPRALYEPKTSFTVGYPSDYGFGVSTRYQQAHRIWVVREPRGIFVIFAKCTHLGCTPDWKEGEKKFKCPCHGSGFDAEGVNFEGPAPRPLDRLYVELDPEGRIVVDKSRKFPDRKTWGDKGAIIAV